MTITNADLLESIKTSVMSCNKPSGLQETENAVESITSYAEFAIELLAFRVWIDKGCPEHQSFDEQLIDLLQAEGTLARSLRGSLKASLQMVTEKLAGIIWHFRGRQVDTDYNRVNNDYHDAKRLLGYLLADRIIQDCLLPKGEERRDCLVYLREEFMPYLVCLSLEEFVRFRAYFIWDQAGRPVDGDARIHYFQALNEVQRTMRNCSLRGPAEFSKLPNSKVLLNYLAKTAYDNLEAIKNAKANAGVRLEFSVWRDAGGFVDRLYGMLGKHQSWTNLSPDQVCEVIRVYRENTHVPNMFEFLARCALCTYSKGEHADESCCQTP